MNMHPKRLSVDEHSADYCRMFEVFLDGKKQTRCTVADVEHGYVIRYKNAIFGIPIKNHKTGKVETETVKGLVRIVHKVNNGTKKT